MDGDASADRVGEGASSAPESHRLEGLLDSVGVVVWEFSTDANSFTFVSPAAEQFLGYPVSEWLRPGFWTSRLHPADATWASTFIDPRVRERRDQQVEYRMVRADGRTIWVRDYVSFGEDGDERLSGLLFDITPQKLAEERLSNSDHRFREVVEGVGLLAIEIDPAGNVVYANAALERLAGGLAPLVGRNLFDLVGPESRETVRRAFEDRLATGGSTEGFRIPLTTPDGQPRELRWRSANAYGPHGEFAGIMSIGEDVTERAAFERERARKAEEFDAIFTLTRDLFFRIDANNICLTYSAPSNEDLYAPPSAFLGRDITKLLPPAVADVLVRGKTRAHDTGRMAVEEYELPLGEEPRAWEARFLPMAGGDTALVIRDITEPNARVRTTHEQTPAELD